MVDLNYQNADTNNDEGGYLIPDPLATEILGLIENASVCEPFLRDWPMTSLTEKINKLSTRPSAYWVSAEAGVKTKSEAKWTQLTLNAEEIAVIIPFTKRWLNNANINVIEYLKEEIVKAFVEKIDKTYLGYASDSPFSDSISGNCPVAHTIAKGTYADILADLSEAMAKVEEDGYEVSGWAAPLSLKNYFRKLRDDENRPIFLPANGDSPDTLYGIPIRFSGNMVATGSPSKKEVICGDWKQALKATREDMSFDIQDTPTITIGESTVNLWEKNMVALKAEAYKGFEIVDANAFAKVTGWD